MYQVPFIYMHIYIYVSSAVYIHMYVCLCIMQYNTIVLQWFESFQAGPKLASHDVESRKCLFLL